MIRASSRTLVVCVSLALAGLPAATAYPKPATADAPAAAPIELLPDGESAAPVAAAPVVDVLSPGVAPGVKPPSRRTSIFSLLWRGKKLPPPPDPDTLSEETMPESFDAGETPDVAAEPAALDPATVTGDPAPVADATDEPHPVSSEPAKPPAAVASGSPVEGAFAVERKPVVHEAAVSDDMSTADAAAVVDLVASVFEAQPLPRLPRPRPADPVTAAATLESEAAAPISIEVASTETETPAEPPLPDSPVASSPETAAANLRPAETLATLSPPPVAPLASSPETAAANLQPTDALASESPPAAPLASSPETAAAKLQPAETLAAMSPPAEPLASSPESAAAKLQPAETLAAASPPAEPPAAGPPVPEVAPEPPAEEPPPAEVAAAEPPPVPEASHVAALPPAEPPATEPPPATLATDMTTPRALVQELQILQDRIAKGSTEALVAQRELLERMETSFAAASPDVWQDRQNAAALVIYVLSGGRPDSLRKVLGHEPLPALDEKLMRGALAYVEGESAKASELLAGIEATNFPPSMGSQIAIAQAALAVAREPERAEALLDIARLLSPGTLAEEAAIRREILVVAQLQDTDKFAMLSRQYIQRFRHSVYAGNFRQRFAAALTRMTFVDDAPQLTRLDDILSDLEPDARRELLLMVARAAVVQAKTEAARFAAGRVIGTAETGSADEARALLYRAAAVVVLPDGLDAARADLARIDQSLLDESDRKLAAAAGEMADAIAAASVPQPLPPEAPAAATADAAGGADASAAQAQPVNANTAAADPNATADPNAAADPEQDSPAVGRAREAIKLADALLGAQPE